MLRRQPSRSVAPRPRNPPEKVDTQPEMANSVKHPCLWVKQTSTCRWRALTCHRHPKRDNSSYAPRTLLSAVPVAATALLLSKPKPSSLHSHTVARKPRCANETSHRALARGHSSACGPSDRVFPRRGRASQVRQDMEWHSRALCGGHGAATSLLPTFTSSSKRASVTAPLRCQERSFDHATGVRNATACPCI